jgi:hypothetical protein
MASFPQVFPPTPCAHLSPPPYAPHAPPMVFLISELDKLVNITTWSLYPRGLNHRYPMNWRLGGLKTRLGNFWEDKTLLKFPVIEPRVVGGTVLSLVTIPTELSVLVYYVIWSVLSSVCTLTNTRFLTSLQFAAKDECLYVWDTLSCAFPMQSSLLT